MAVWAQDDFEGTPTSGSFDPANHDVMDAVVSGTISYTAETVAGYRSVQSGGPASAWGYKNLGGRTRVRMRWLAKWQTASGAAGHHFLLMTADGSTAYRGDVQIRNAAGTPVYNRWNFSAVTPQPDWAADTPWRFEYDWERGVSATLYIWTDPDSAGAPDYTIPVSAPSTDVARFAWGSSNGPSGKTVFYAGVAFSDGEPIGPLVSEPPKEAAGGSTASVSVAAEAAGTKMIEGGSTAAVSVSSFGGQPSESSPTVLPFQLPAQLGGAPAKTASGGSTTSVVVVGEGAGRQVVEGRGGSTASVLVSGSSSGVKTAVGGSTAAVGSPGVGGGFKSSTGGVATGVTVAAMGAGVRVHAGGSTTTVAAAVEGAGWKTASGTSTTGVTVTATGGGRAPVSGRGGGTANVTIAGEAAGAKTVTYFATEDVAVTATAAGTKQAVGGATTGVGVEVTSASAPKTATGGATAEVVVVGLGAGSTGELPNDIDVSFTVGAPYANHLTAGDSRLVPWRTLLHDAAWTASDLVLHGAKDDPTGSAVVDAIAPPAAAWDADELETVWEADDLAVSWAAEEVRH